MAALDFSEPLYALAPLAGFTDLPFRSVVKKFGVDLTVSEMISSNALIHNSKKTYKMLEKSPVEDPYSIQIAGSDLDVIRRAVEIINEQEGVSVIDLNCGCPAPKVVNNLQGSSLLTDLPGTCRLRCHKRDQRDCLHSCHCQWRYRLSCQSTVGTRTYRCGRCDDRPCRSGQPLDIQTDKRGNGAAKFSAHQRGGTGAF